MSMFSSVFELQMRGYRLSTAEILYHLPDHPGLLQSFIWQHYDLAPEYPELQGFIRYWRNNIEAELHKVIIGHSDVLMRPNFRSARDVARLN